MCEYEIEKAIDEILQKIDTLVRKKRGNNCPIIERLEAFEWVQLQVEMRQILEKTLLEKSKSGRQRDCKKGLHSSETKDLKFGGWEVCPYCHIPVGRGEWQEHIKICRERFHQINEDMKGCKPDD